MRKVYNATRHWQRNLPLWERLEVEFVPTNAPGIKSVRPNMSADVLMDEVDETMRKVRESGATTVMIGGISGLAVLIACRALAEGLDIVEPTINGRDRNGRLNVTGLRELTGAMCEILDMEEGDGDGSGG